MTAAIELSTLFECIGIAITGYIANSNFKVLFLRKVIDAFCMIIIRYL